MFTKQLQQYIEERFPPYITPKKKKKKKERVQVAPQEVSFRHQFHIYTNIKKNTSIPHHAKHNYVSNIRNIFSNALKVITLLHFFSKKKKSQQLKKTELYKEKIYFQVLCHAHLHLTL